MPRVSRTMVVVPGGVLATASPGCGCSDIALASSFGGATGSGVWPAANLAIYIPFDLDFEITVLRIVCMNGSTANGNIDMGIYDAFGNRLVSKGATAQSGTSGPQALDTTDLLLTPGSYYMALAASSATATFNRLTGFSALALQACGVQQQDLTGVFPLPATATFANPTNNYVPLMALDFKGTL